MCSCSWVISSVSTADIRDSVSLPMSNKIDSTEIREGTTGCLKMGYLPEYWKEYWGLQFMALIQRDTTTVDILKASVNRPIGARESGNEMILSEICKILQTRSRPMKFRHWKLNNLELNYSRLENSFEFLLNGDQETQNNLHTHFETITFFAQMENKKECQSKNIVKNCFVSTYYTRYKFISIIHFLDSFSYEVQSLKDSRFVWVQIWIKQILTRDAFIVFHHNLLTQPNNPPMRKTNDEKMTRAAA